MEGVTEVKESDFIQKIKQFLSSFHAESKGQIIGGLFSA